METTRTPMLAKEKAGLRLVLWPDPRLTKTVPRVEAATPELLDTINSMKEFMKIHDGAGLAGPQVGLMNQVLVYFDPKGENGATHMINPSIYEKSPDETLDWEGCLSFPGVSIRVPRSIKILVEYDHIEVRDGVPLLFGRGPVEFKGWEARVIQHEIDHLSGRTYLQFLSRLKRDLVDRKLRKIKKKVDRQAEKLQGMSWLKQEPKMKIDETK